MITPRELRTIERDLLSTFEDLVILQTRHKHGMPDSLFRTKVTARLKELLLVAQNTERASYNRDIMEDSK